MKYTFLKLAGGKEGRWGWWLVVTPDDAEKVMDIHKRISQSMFLRFQRNPHFVKSTLDQGPIELAAKWLQTMEKFLGRGLTVYVNENGGMMGAGRDPGFEPLAVVRSERMAFPPAYESIARRKIDIQRWYGGEHYYLQCQDKMIFSKEKFDTLAEARTEAELYALPENIRLSDAQFIYTREGD